MKSYKRIYTDNGFGEKDLTEYRCIENPRITIRIERGSILHNRPTGFTVLFDGTTDYTNSIASFLTLNEAKYWAEQI